MTNTNLVQHAGASISLWWALFYAQWKLAVFPLHYVFDDGGCSCGSTECGPVGKHPMTSDGFKSASSDPDKVRWFFEGEPDANIGVRTGAESGVVVLDVDPRHGGHLSLAELVQQHGALPATPAVRTGSGGMHYYFAHPGGGAVFPNRQNMRPGLDLRGDGGYAVGAGSNHIQGDYAFEPGRRFGEVALAPMPPWLADMARTPNGVIVPPPVPGSVDVPIISDGERNATLFALASAMRGKGMSRAGIEAALQAENTVRCQPALGDKEIGKIVASVMKYPAGAVPRARSHSALPREEVVRQTKEQFESAADPKVSTESVNFVVRGLVAERSITLITGKPKVSGKSTLVAHMVSKVIDGHHFLGFPVTKTPAVVLTEERTTFVELLRRTRLMGRDDVRFLRWDPSRDATFAEQMVAAKGVAHETGAKLIVVDTLAQFIGLRGDAENDPGSALESLKPIQDAAREGFAVVVVHHEKKSGGGVGDSSRGSTAFTGAVDIILSVSRPEGQTSSQVRVINTLSRYPATPDVLFVELTDHGYERREEAGVVTAAVEKVLLEAAPEEEANAVAIPALIAGTTFKESTVRKVANQLVAEGRLYRKGGGKKGDPHTYWRSDSCHTTPSPGSAASDGDSSPPAQ